MKCAIITPIGPGHRETYEQDCLPSIQRAIAHGTGPFESIETYPMWDLEAQHGRSARRNTALRNARNAGIEWVFFLDADDFMAEGAFESFGRALSEHPEIDVVWGKICEKAEDGSCVDRLSQPLTIKSREEFLGVQPWLSVQIGAFVRTACAVEILFDESMDTGEDFKFYYSLWEHHNCIKLPSIFFENRRGMHSTGPRSANGADWNAAVSRLWKAELVKCRGIARATAASVDARFIVTNPDDLIQAAHTFGQFFEGDVLSSLVEYLDEEPSLIVDVGSNIGNHTIFFAQRFSNAKIIPVEPNPAAIAALRANIEINASHGSAIKDRIDPRGIGLGVGREEMTVHSETIDANNLGATRLIPDDNGDLRVVTLDSLLQDEMPDILKIDAEGMELDVLAGAAETIARCRPLIWIEVLRANQMAFAQRWCRENGYRVVSATHLVNTVDYIVKPRRP